jgi:3-hydroxyisobutyrate dehydrogenase-like beta-hydroxyacid dehydrogenase
MAIKVGFIGLGQMGKWMASNLVKRKFNLTVFDIVNRGRS